MPCTYLSQDHLLNFYYKRLTAEEDLLIEEHILSCDLCFEEFMFLKKLEFHSGFLEENAKDYKQYNLYDFIIELDHNESLINSHIMTFGKHIKVSKEHLATRNDTHLRYFGVKIFYNNYPTIHFFYKNLVTWSCFLEESIDLLSIHINNKLFYKAYYSAKDVLDFPAGENYSIQKDNQDILSFKINNKV